MFSVQDKIRPTLILGTLLSLSLAAAGAARAADSTDPDWPCVQRQMPTISAGMVWAGPPVAELPAGWDKEAEVAGLANRISARSLDMEKAAGVIAEFAAEQQPDIRNQKLTALFAATLERINSERDSIMSGIKRYARHQAKLGQKIELMTVEIEDIPATAGEDELAYKAQLEEQRLWDVRIFDEREASLTYVCETPVLLEKRAFALGREIMSKLEK